MDPFLVIPLKAYLPVPFLSSIGYANPTYNKNTLYQYRGHLIPIYWNYYPTSAPLLDYLMEDRDILPISLAGAKVSIKSDITKYFKKV
nr:MAG TPA: hypothetical protein [Crassvirales sp.]